MGAAVPGQSPETKAAWAKFDNAIASNFQNRWWTAQAEQFDQLQGQNYERGKQQLKVDYDTEIAAALEAGKDEDIIAARQAAERRMWMSLEKLSSQYMNDVSRYANNPIIAQRGEAELTRLTGIMSKMTGAGQRAAEEQKTLAETERARAQAGAAERQDQGFYNETNAAMLSSIPAGRARDAIITMKGGRVEIDKEKAYLQQELEGQLGRGMAEYKAAVAKGNAELASIAARKFEEKFFVDPDFLGDKEGDALLEIWRNKSLAELENQAANLIYQRSIDARRGFAPKADTKAPAAPGTAVRREEVAPQIAPVEGATPEETRRLQQAQQMGGLPSYKPELMSYANEEEETEATNLEASLKKIAKEGGGKYIPDPTRLSEQAKAMAVQMLAEGTRNLPSEVELRQRAGRRTTTKGHRGPSAKEISEHQTYMKQAEMRVMNIMRMPDPEEGQFPEGFSKEDVQWLRLIDEYEKYIHKYPGMAGNFDVAKWVAELEVYSAKRILGEKDVPRYDPFTGKKLPSRKERAEKQARE
jgi:hypothetical protein